ncbi:adenine nucleotide alpha hydrolase [Scheffersomyces stipitis CBS 6054]|uniref:Diphthine--ammonia ligase n=1 Tax=Scheffersomyces stipitis (strain ATCC 58785 / CBS 6054 / NBRC 10063 / NRRL Y-11545) TaxID=322104 RepID=A3LRQ5_PICST|nr:adenine nucleotide alpha hydrolase [Scheffersomyces stipitis CBS 6054]ABN65776.2 adenine nucleotide alpha hydrolase [Scheffersomyces stipitis CBS 6054]KAG2734032.1 hypothetical protein G9P44_003557 [Scheffersomyces stipitis]
MKFVALISGGKDSFFNIHHCLSNGHELVALANLYPEEQNKDEIDSFMFQTVGHDIIDSYSECLGVPIYRQAITGGSTNQSLEYSKTENDEIEDLYKLLKSVKEAHPDVVAVSCGAILSHYQRTRVENVCGRLNLTSLAYLWQRDQYELMQEMIRYQLDARLIKVAAIGLNSTMLGKSITEMFPTLVKLNSMYDVHICGEGGEFETIVLDSPIFKKKLEITDREVIDHSSDDVSYLRVKVKVLDKEHFQWTKIACPPLLKEEFSNILGSAPVLDISTLQIKETETQPKSLTSEKLNLDVVIKSTETKLYISNLMSDKDSPEENTADIFMKLASLLEDAKLSFNNIQHITLLLSDMSLFEKVNGIYSKSFENLYLPPSRICIETELPSSIMLSCIVLKDQNADKKTGLHIRSRSYWAPQNIGPYSQTTVEQRETYKLATLSGQIPLVPSSMVLNEADITYNSLLSLEHLHKVKSLVGVKKLAQVICFVTKNSYVPTASWAWDAYNSDFESSSNSPQMVIVKVKSLPKGANIEWGGLSYEKLVDMYHDSDDDEDNDQGKEVLLEDVSKFDTSSVVNVSNSERIATLFTDDSTVATDFIAKYNKTNYIEVLSTQNDFIDIFSIVGKNAVGVLPVQAVFDNKGKPFRYALIAKLEKQ